MKRAGVQERSGSSPSKKLQSRELVKFTALVALAAIFIDASIGHGLLWENDPYWTYWITKTFLIATIFGLGTATLGAGPGRGAVITAAHTIVLTVYYWSLSPIGLPSSPEWLDLEHTWITGIPVHFGVIYLGYLIALWIFEQRRDGDQDSEEAGKLALTCLIAALAIVAVGGGISSLALGEFPGATWFLVRFLITFPLLFGWWALVGRSFVSALVGGSLLALVWTTYGHYLSPNGLPDLPLRIFEAAPPSATVEWASYRDLWLVSLPLYTLAMVAVMAVWSPRQNEAKGRFPAGLFATPLILLLGVGMWNPDWVQPANGTIVSSGSARVEAGPWYSDDFNDAEASLRMSFVDQASRVTPLPPHDKINLRAEIMADEGTITVTSDQVMVSHPEGRHTTWWGVGIHVDHHGHSGTGTSRLPNIDSELAVFALADVEVDGQPIAKGVPIHVMTADAGLPGGAHLELDVGQPGVSLPGIPDGHLRVLWDDYEGGPPEGAQAARYTMGGLVLLVLLLSALSLIRPKR